MSRRVAVTGLGAITPLGVGVDALIDRWSAGESGIEDGLGTCRDFDPDELLTRKEVRRADRFTQLALAACREAAEQAGWEDGPPSDPGRVGCILGTGIGGIGTIEEQLDKLRDKGAEAVSPLAVPLMMANAASGVVAMSHGLKGQCYGTVSACAAGAHAIGTGMRMIQHGDAEACIVGGSEAGLTSLAKAAFAGMGASSPSGISRPFDARRDGFIMGEGAAALVIEPEEAAEKRGAEVLGYLTGYGATADAHHLTAPEPSGDGASRAIDLALADAGLEPGELDYVNAHGTSTPLNDASETAALKRSLGERAGELPISSLKSAVGHLLGAAGAVEAVATLLSLQRGIAPPTLGWEERDEDCDLDYVPEGVREIGRNGAPLRAISNSFGFGGHNAVLCLEAA